MAGASEVIYISSDSDDDVSDTCSEAISFICQTPPQDDSDGDVSDSGERTSQPEAALTPEELMESASESVDGDLLSIDGKWLVLRLPRASVTKMARDAFGWNDADGDIVLRVMPHPAFAGNLRLELKHDLAESSRLVMQLKRIMECHVNEAPYVGAPRGVQRRWVLDLFNYLQSRLPTLADHCIVCDAPQEPGVKRWRPTCCTDQKCEFAVEELPMSLEHDLAAIIATPAAIDLQVSLMLAAVKGPGARRDLLFAEKFPSRFLPKEDKSKSGPAEPSSLLAAANAQAGQLRDGLLIAAAAAGGVGGVLGGLVPSAVAKSGLGSAVDWATVQSVLQCTPKFEELAVLGAIEKLHNQEPELSALLRWVINSNHGHLVQVTDEATLAIAMTKSVFLVQSSDERRQCTFEKRKRAAGSSLFAFHGSPLGNWHSILRKGVVNASGTALQANGAAYGKGVYLGCNSATSLTYCGHRSGVAGQAVGWEKSEFGAAPVCMALCEVVGGSDSLVPNPVPGGPPVPRATPGMLVISNDMDVIVRCLLLFGESDRSLSVDAAALGGILSRSPQFQELFGHK